MRRINREETRKLLERAIRQWFNTTNAVAVYDPIYEDEIVDENLINLKIGEISGGTIVVNPIFYGNEKEEIEDYDFYNQQIKYDNITYYNGEELVKYLLEEAEEREIGKIIDELEDQIYQITDEYKNKYKLDIKIRQNTDEYYDNSYRPIVVLVKGKDIK